MSKIYVFEDYLVGPFDEIVTKIPKNYPLAIMFSYAQTGTFCFGKNYLTKIFDLPFRLARTKLGLLFIAKEMDATRRI